MIYTQVLKSGVHRRLGTNPRRFLFFYERITSKLSPTIYYYNLQEDIEDVKNKLISPAVPTP
jgi:hypothetical protein